MARVQTMVQLSDSLVQQLDAEAAAQGISRSALIREVIEAGLAESRDAALSRRIVEGYTRVPQGRPDAWGNLEEMSHQSSVEALRRLDAEETVGW